MRAWGMCTSAARVTPRRYVTTSTTTAAAAAVTQHPSDFDHHAKHVARLNHGSFGAVPRPVLDRQDAIRRSWLAQPDEWYFSGKLHEGLRDSAAAAATTLVPETSPHLPMLLENPQQVCLVENATVGAVTVARRWAKLIEPGDVVIHLDIAYKACVHVLREHCAQAGATLVEIRTPFLASTEDEICAAVEEQLKALCSSTRGPRYAFLDHVSSQPAVLLPAKRLTALCRDYGCEEVAVDGAHSVGSVHDLDVVDMDCDFFFSNLHKWGFAPGTATVFFCKTPELAAATHHPITSWDYPQGIAEESLFPGTRDFSAILAVPAAVEYLKAWRSADGLTSAEHCKREVQAAAAQLRFVWESEDVDPAASMEESLIATQAGLRTTLREDYDIEAAIGNFGDGNGSFVRLSYAVYNQSRDISRLRDAVMEILEDQRYA